MSEKIGNRTRRSIAVLAGATCACAGVGTAGAAVTLNIAADTYVDTDYPAGTTGFDNRPINYGSSAAVKAVVSNGSTMFPGPSVVHGLIELPASFWADIGTADIASATVTYAVRNNSSNGRAVELHPLTQAFTSGLGGTASSTMGDTNNSSGSPTNGADLAHL